MQAAQVASMKNYVVRDISEHAKCGAHPNVTQYLKCFTTDKHLGIVTQYAAGGDLMSIIAAQCVAQPSVAGRFGAAQYYMRCLHILSVLGAERLWTV